MLKDIFEVDKQTDIHQVCWGRVCRFIYNSA